MTWKKYLSAMEDDISIQKVSKAELLRNQDNILVQKVAEVVGLEKEGKPCPKGAAMVPCNVELFALFELLVALEHQAFMDDDELTQMPKRKWEATVAKHVGQQISLLTLSELLWQLFPVFGSVITLTALHCKACQIH